MKLKNITCTKLLKTLMKIFKKVLLYQIVSYIYKLKLEIIKNCKNEDIFEIDWSGATIHT